MKIIAFTLALLSILANLGVCWATEITRQPEHIGPTLDLSRRVFIEEMIYPQGTSRTPKFDDYTSGSYHVGKLDLVDGVRDANKPSHRVDAVLVLGPSGPLWQYNIITVVSGDSSSNTVRINNLVFPHARITYKSTRTTTRDSYVKSIASIMSNVALREPTKDDRQEDGEWKMVAVIATFEDNGRIRVLPISAIKERQQEAKQLYDEINQLLGGEEAITTYSHSIKD